jgi:hypothetical protein
MPLDGSSKDCLKELLRFRHERPKIVESELPYVGGLRRIGNRNIEMRGWRVAVVAITSVVNANELDGVA